MEPLFDLPGRVLALGTGASTCAVIDALLRFHAGKQNARPITLYVVGADGGTPLPAADALLLTGVIRVVRPPVRTVGLGLLQGWQPLVLACGTVGERFLLPQTLLAPGRLDLSAASMPRRPVGLYQVAPLPRRDTIEECLQKQFESLLSDLNLSPELFTEPRIWTAQEAVTNHLADQVVERILTPQLSPAIHPVLK